MRQTAKTPAGKPEIGVFLPSVGPEPGGTAAEIKAAARRAEELGFAHVWTGDHLVGRTTMVESGLTLATAAAVTERIGIGFGVLHLPLHPVVQTAQRLATLQHFSGGRVLLGVGSGGTGPRARWRGGVRDTTAWQAAGLAYEDRDRLFDRALDLLPELLSGDPVRLADHPGTPELTLTPKVDAPPLLIGGTSAAALRRAVQYGAQWFPSLAPPRQLATGREVLAELAAGVGRAQPPGVSVALPFGLGPATRPREQVTKLVSETYGVPADQAGAVMIGGEPAQAAEQLAAYAEAGAARIVLSTPAENWRQQYELLAEAAALL
ncbi:LLM class flavin-dependent oxidoreductase [Streptomyces sp. LX-29]|uniref:LLM class flavin-dependent oxidoreductase n=1 Tax=Streptomyces sp. LX-29 TaxID=2900152 RepID=UPI00240D03AE|nr:LLM class flavin-dependent oxidoreductase [Streptomyces sp. LX-29]WFB08821.1 LLM class flavin-dependent oxidoreductase [Streptomyces sp. LX-29]